MTTVALQQALKWHDDLMDRFFRGRRDKESAIRSRLSEASGVPESYLVRLAHKRRELRSLDAEMYRLLDLAHAKYVRACERIEAAADALRDERLKSESKENAADTGDHQTGRGMDTNAAAAGKE